MSSKYGVGKNIHDGDLYDYVNTFTNDIPFYKKYCLQANGDVLEICSGTGRLTIPLAKEGINITGVDFTESMLKKAKIKAEKENLNIDFIKGDMRNFNLNKKFPLVFIPFNSIQNIYSIEDVENTFRTVKKHLNDDGLFILDIFNPSIDLMAKRSGKTTEVTQFIRDDGIKVRITETSNYESESQINRVEWTHHIGEKKYIDKLDMRCFYPLEMDALLKYNGFKIIAKFGDFEENEFNSKSMKQIFLCKNFQNP